MRIFLYSIAIISLIGSASANRPVSGVVAVSTGPMQAKYMDATLEIGRDLAAGDSVFLNDKVETGQRTQAQVLLKDESVFSISPNSKVLFDQFVFDPFEQTGTVSAKLLAGGLRFVSGKIADQQPQNVEIKAGTATVGIRGTEIVAKHSDEGSTFVLLSGAMDISTPTGLQTINRPGFGLDVSADGTLGSVRRVPLQEINQLLSPPANPDEDSASDDGEEASTEDDNTDTAAEEESASDEGGRGADDEEDTTADATSPTETDSADNQSADNSEISSDAASTEDTASAEKETKSSFDSALLAAAKSDGDTEQAEVSGLSDLNLEVAAENTTSSEAKSEEAANAETKSDEIAADNIKTADTEPNFSGENAAASIIDALVEDKKDEQGVTVAEEIARAQSETQPEPTISLAIETSGTLTAKPFFSSNANLLIRSTDFFKSEAPDQFNVTHALLREKFPNSFNDDGIINHASPRPTESEIDLSDYDAILIYADWENDDNFNAVERTAYRAFIHEDGKKVLTIGRQENDMETANTVLRIYSPDDDATTYQYSAYTDTRDPETNYLLSPNDSSTSELLLGVGDFPNYYAYNGFRAVEFEKTLNGVAQPFTDTSEFILANEGVSNSFAALDLGDKGAVHLSRWSCGASSNGALGVSIDANFVNNSREQFCRNLISSIAPDDTLVDVEVGTLSISGDTEEASYRLISGGSNNFKIIGDSLILDSDANLEAGSYDFIIGVTSTGGDEIERTVSVSVADGEAEKRVVSTKASYNVGDTVSFSRENLVSHTDYLEDISWVSIGDNSGGGTPTNTGIITLHYRITEGDSTYDRFEEIEINHDCSSDHCKEFATSMDTEDDLEDGSHYDAGATTVNNVFEANDFTAWSGTPSGFFDRFTTGTGRFTGPNYQGTWPYNFDYHYDLEINYESRVGILEADGTLSNYTLDERWEFNFLQSGGACESHICSFSDDTEGYDLRVHLANVSLPNGKYGLLIRSERYMNGSGTSTDWTPMTPR